MDWQLALVGAAVAAAVGYLARSAWRTWFAGKPGGCGSGCGKCATPADEPKATGRITLPRV